MARGTDGQKECVSAEGQRESLASPAHKNVGVDVLGLGGITQKETSRICVCFFVPQQRSGSS